MMWESSETFTWMEWKHENPLSGYAFPDRVSNMVHPPMKIPRKHTLK
jgi:hypothetical protein